MINNRIKSCFFLWNRGRGFKPSDQLCKIHIYIYLCLSGLSPYTRRSTQSTTWSTWCPTQGWPSRSGSTSSALKVTRRRFIKIIYNCFLLYFLMYGCFFRIINWILQLGLNIKYFFHYIFRLWMLNKSVGTFMGFLD